MSKANRNRLVRLREFDVPSLCQIALFIDFAFGLVVVFPLYWVRGRVRTAIFSRKYILFGRIPARIRECNIRGSNVPVSLEKRPSTPYACKDTLMDGAGDRESKIMQPTIRRTIGPGAPDGLKTGALRSCAPVLGPAGPPG